jgi:hypothetical protein
MRKQTKRTPKMNKKTTKQQLLLRRPNIKKKKGFNTPGNITRSSRIKHYLYRIHAKKIYKDLGPGNQDYVNILDATKEIADELDKMDDIDLEDIVESKTVVESPAPTLIGIEVACEAALQYFLRFPDRSLHRRKLLGSMFYSLTRQRVKDRDKKSPHV